MAKNHTCVNPRGFNKQEALARQILTKGKGVLFIKKVTRVGFTTSTVKEAISQRKKVLVLFPTRKMCEDGIENIKKLINGNVCILDLAKNRDICYCTDPNLPEDVFPIQFHGPCYEWVKLVPRNGGRPRAILQPCSDSGRCDFFQIVGQLEIGNFDILTMTYDKFFGLMKSNSPITDNIFKGIKDHVDVVIFDEARKLAEISTSSHSRDSIKEAYTSLKTLMNQPRSKPPKHMAKFKEAIKHIRDTSKAIKRSGSNYPRSQSINLENKSLEAKDCAQVMNTLISWYPGQEEEVGGIPKALHLVGDKKIIAIQFKANSPINLYLDPDEEFQNRRAMLQRLEEQGKTILLGDATLPITQLEELYGQHQIEIWPDFNDTERQQLIIASPGKAHVWGWLRKDSLQKRSKKRLLRVVKTFGPKEVMAVVFNKKVKRIVKQWKKTDPALKGLKVTHFRSTETQSVPSDRRIMFCIMLPFSRGESHEIEEILTNGLLGTAKELQERENSATTVQAVGRAKDPGGLDKSVVFIDGSTKEQVEDFLKVQRPNKGPLPRPKVLEPIKGRFLPDAITMGKWWLDKVDQGIDDDDMHAFLNCFPYMAKLSNELRRGVVASRIIRNGELRLVALAFLIMIEPGVTEYLNNQGRPKNEP